MKQKNKVRKRWLGFTLLLSVCVLASVFFVSTVEAKGFWGWITSPSEDIVKILNRYDEYLTQANMVTSVLRTMGWGLIWLLDQGIQLFNGATLDLLNMGNFFEASEFSDILNTFDSVKGFLLLLSLLLIFTMMLFGKKVEMSQAFTNLMLSMVIVMALPTFVSSLLDVTTDVSTSLSSDASGIGIGKKTILNNASDLTVFAEHNWISPDKIEDKAGIKDTKYIQINQQITKPKDFGGDGVLGYRLDWVDGEEKAVEFDPDVGFGKRWAQNLIGEGYYRWHVNFFTIIFTLAALNVAYILAGVRMGRMMIELAFNQGFATILAFADFRTMARLKQVLLNIVGILCAIVAIFATFSVFSAFVTFVVEKDVSGVAYIFALIGAIWFVLDGPVMIQKVLGVDAGMSSAWGAVGGMMGLKALGKAIGATKDIAKASLGMAANGAAFLGGAMAGMASKASGADNSEGLSAKGLSEALDKESGNGSSETAKGLNEGKTDESDTDTTQDSPSEKDKGEDNVGISSDEGDGESTGISSDEGDGESTGINSDESEGESAGINSDEGDGESTGINSDESEGESAGINSDESNGENADQTEPVNQMPSTTRSNEDESLYSEMPPQDESLYESEPPRVSDEATQSKGHETSPINQEATPKNNGNVDKKASSPIKEAQEPSTNKGSEATINQPQHQQPSPQKSNAFKTAAVNRVKNSKIGQSAMKGYQMGKGSTDDTNTSSLTKTKK